MIDHACVKASSALFAETVRFYEKALLPLGYKKMREIPSRAAGFGQEMPDFWVFSSIDKYYPAQIALRAKDRETVKKFHDPAIDAGGNDDGEPDLRKQIHEHCYAALVHDPAGNNVEAVCHSLE